jgi:hypothetical protein
MAAITTAVAVGVAAAATVYQADQAGKQRRTAEEAAGRQRDEAAAVKAEGEKQAQELEAQKKTQEDRGSAIKDRNKAVGRQQALRSGANQKGGTLLTSPLGGSAPTSNVLGDSQAGGAKTLLGQ